MALVSSGPPRAEVALVSGLGLTQPMGCLDGAVIANPNLSVIEAHEIDADTALSALRAIELARMEVWAYTATDWFVSTPKGIHIAEESRSARLRPIVTRDFAKILPAVVKLVGTCSDQKRIDRTAQRLASELGERASISTRRDGFLEVLHPQSNKGGVVAFFRRRYGLKIDEIACIGDGESDIAMFEQCGLSIAMETAPESVKERASEVTARAEADGFACAVEDYILPAASQKQKKRA